MWLWQKTCKLSHALLPCSSSICALTCPCIASRRSRACNEGQCKQSKMTSEKAGTSTCVDAVYHSVVSSWSCASGCTPALSIRQALCHRGINPEQGSLQTPQAKWSDSQGFSHPTGSLTFLRLGRVCGIWRLTF